MPLTPNAIHQFQHKGDEGQMYLSTSNGTTETCRAQESPRS